MNESETDQPKTLNSTLMVNLSSIIEKIEAMRDVEPEQFMRIIRMIIDLRDYVHSLDD